MFNNETIKYILLGLIEDIGSGCKFTICTRLILFK